MRCSECCLSWHAFSRSPTRENEGFLFLFRTAVKERQQVFFCYLATTCTPKSTTEMILGTTLQNASRTPSGRLPAYPGLVQFFCRDLEPTTERSTWKMETGRYQSISEYALSERGWHGVSWQYVVGVIYGRSDCDVMSDQSLVRWTIHLQLGF